MKKNVKVVAYDSKWPEIFEKEALLIKKTLKENCIDIHHVGSTSVPDLIAKPKIDMILIVEDPLQACHQLKEIGIDYRGEYNIPLHYGFSKRGEIDFNIHGYQNDHPEIELNLIFRDYLRKHPEKRDEYALLKKELIKDQSSFNQESLYFVNYTLRKGDFIREILKEAGFNRLRVLKCNDHTEWKKLRSLRDEYFSEYHCIEDPYQSTFNHQDHSHLVLYQGYEVIGCAHIEFFGDKTVMIEMIIIDKHKRRQNSGSFFLRFIEKWLKSLGFTIIYMRSLPKNIMFCLKNNYAQISSNNLEKKKGDLNHVLVRKCI